MACGRGAGRGCRRGLWTEDASGPLVPVLSMKSSLLRELQALLPQALLTDQLRLGARLAKALQERHRPGAQPPPLEAWIAAARRSAALRQQRATLAGRVHYPPELPISSWREEIVQAIREHPVVVLAGETGSGKTTQIPKMCLEAGLGQRARVGCTQPRRIAALAVSRRIAEELDVRWGVEVGCKIRFADHARPETSIKVMTDGILLAEIQGDPWLSEYDAILLDEAHERSLNIDFLLGYLRGLLPRRNDLKLIITSATIDTGAFSRAFGNAPVIEVSGRLFPVEVRHSPVEEWVGTEAEGTYVDATVAAASSAIQESEEGDVLVFLPSERDIREACAGLRRRWGTSVEVLPLYGRLTTDEQQRIFAPGLQRRIVVATNIAETSLTVPRIRYVVDAGLARVSRYHAGTRSRRLPIEPVAQSSARQRAGRCGRIADGVCIRLYSEAEFAGRPLQPEPEIRRCNLADVVLRMKAFQLGEIETFPFLDPPRSAAIEAAYQLLEELGALDEQRQLTGLGQELARLPVDPSLGRMLLQARQEKALCEVLVIATGLSIQDPRERPHDRKDVAEAAHRKFQHPESDFLTLLNIWNAFHETWESLLTQSQLRRFCRTHFLSFVRMREWTDLHAQVAEALSEVDETGGRRRVADVAAIHRSILAGLLGYVGQQEERNTYRMAGGRLAFVFPGSALFLKRVPSGKATPRLPTKAGPPSLPRPPAWIVAGELVETSRLFARTLAGIDPLWIIELAPSLCRTSHDAPRWDREQGCVIATERVHFRGLLLRERTVAYADVDPQAATEIFLRSALIAGDLDGRFPFLEHNRKLREKIEWWQTRLRQRLVPDLDEAFYRFYVSRLQNVASVPHLQRVLKAAGNPQCLWATASDLLGEHAALLRDEAVPDSIPLGTQTVGVDYCYAPGEDRDGVTLKVAAPLVRVLEPGQLDWGIPALCEERVRHVLRSLPKNVRRSLPPAETVAADLLKSVSARDASFPTQASGFLKRRHGVEVAASAWSASDLPPHLRPRLEVHDAEGHTLTVGRDLQKLQLELESRSVGEPDLAWQRAVARWDRYGLAAWDFGDLDDPIRVGEVAGFPLVGYAGLQVEQGEVNLRLFRKLDEAESASRIAIPLLAERVLHREVAWLQNELRALFRWKDLYATLGSADQLCETGWLNLHSHLFPPPPRRFLAAREFADYLERARGLLPGLAVALSDRVGAILQKRYQALLVKRPLPGMRREIDALVPPRFLERIPFERLPHLPRYLQALIVRAERAAVSSAKDAEKSRRVQPYAAALAELLPAAAGGVPSLAVEQFRWLVEEFKVSCYAQELGTATPVSPKRLDEALAQARASTRPAPFPTAVPPALRRTTS